MEGAQVLVKTTCSSRYAAEHENTTHFSAGDRLRAIACGAIASRFIVDSNRVITDDQTMTNIVGEALDTMSSELILLDGYPRFPQATELFLDMAHRRNYILSGLVSFVASETICLERVLSRGRRLGDMSSQVGVERAAVLRYRQDVELVAQLQDTLRETVPQVATLNANSELSVVQNQFDVCIDNMKNTQ